MENAVDQKVRFGPPDIYSKFEWKIGIDLNITIGIIMYFQKYRSSDFFLTYPLNSALGRIFRETSGFSI